MPDPVTIPAGPRSLYDRLLRPAAAVYGVLSLLLMVYSFAGSNEGDLPIPDDESSSRASGHILSNWNYTPGSNCEVAYSFSDRFGVIDGVKLIQSSNDPEMDRSALEALKKSSPVPPMHYSGRPSRFAWYGIPLVAVFSFSDSARHVHVCCPVAYQLDTLAAQYKKEQLESKTPSTK